MPRGKPTMSAKPAAEAEKAPPLAGNSSRARKQPSRLTETSVQSKPKSASKATKKATKTGKSPASKGKQHAASPSKKKATKTRTVTHRAIKGSKRSFPSMVVAAISTLHHRGGSSYQAIGNFIAEKHPDVVQSSTSKTGRSGKSAIHNKVMRAIHRLEKEGQVDRHGHSYRLTTKAKHTGTKMSTKTSATKTTKSGKAKKEKDPNKPKRPLTAFMFFSKDIRPTVKAENPNITFGQLGTIIGERWAKASPAEKKKYETQAAKDKTRYDNAMAAYVPPAGSAAAKKAEKANKPKRPPSEWNLFMKDEVARIRAKDPSIAQKDAMKLAGVEWKKKHPSGAPTKTASPPKSKAAASKPAAKTASPPKSKPAGKTAKK